MRIRSTGATDVMSLVVLNNSDPAPVFEVFVASKHISAALPVTPPKAFT
jgi:hypothetical protein